MSAIQITPPPKKETFKRIDFEVKWNWYIGVVHHEQNNLSKHHVRNAAWKNKHRSIAKQGDFQSPFLDKARHFVVNHMFVFGWFSCLIASLLVFQLGQACQPPFCHKYQEPKNVAMSAESLMRMRKSMWPIMLGSFPTLRLWQGVIWRRPNDVGKTYPPGSLITYPTLGKGKNHWLKRSLGWDIWVPRRVKTGQIRSRPQHDLKVGSILVSGNGIPKIFMEIQVGEIYFADTKCNSLRCWYPFQDMGETTACRIFVLYMYPWLKYYQSHESYGLVK